VTQETKLSAEIWRRLCEETY